MFYKSLILCSLIFLSMVNNSINACYYDNSEEEYYKKYPLTSAGIRAAVRADEPQAIDRICSYIEEDGKPLRVNRRGAPGDNSL